MKNELQNIIRQEIDKESNKAYANKISDEYFQYYIDQSENTKAKFKKLIEKYNERTIERFLGENGCPEDYIHMSLGHNMGEKTLTPMLDNGGGIYPPDLEIGNIIEDPQFWSNEETDEEWELRDKCHGLIFFAWLSNIWSEIEGFKSKIVVKTTENNSVTSFYLNDFQFDSNSKFDLEPNWRKVIDEFNMKTIDAYQLIENIKKEYSR